MALHFVYAHPRRVRTITHLGGVFPELYDTSNNDLLKSFLNKDIIIFKKGKEKHALRSNDKVYLKHEKHKSRIHF